MKNLRPIKSAEDHEAALKQVEILWEFRSGTPEGDRLEILTTLIEAYEAKAHPFDLPDPIEAIRYHLESRGCSHRDLEPLLGDSRQVQEILDRKRPLTLPMIRELHEGLGIPAEILIQPYATKVEAA
jgi:HTH-type transcriptional regulator/antitoxin HigA